MTDFKTIIEARNSDTRTEWRIKESISNGMFWLENKQVNWDGFEPQDYGTLQEIMNSFSIQIGKESFLIYP